MNERNITIKDLAAMYGIAARTLRNRARAAGIDRIGRDYVLTPDEAKGIIYHRPAGRPRKGDHSENVSTSSSQPSG